MDEEEYNPFWHSGAAALLLSGIIVSMYLFLLQPAQDNSEVMRQKVENLEGRIEQKKCLLERIRQKNAELERGDPQTVREAIRQELLKGKSNEFVL